MKASKLIIDCSLNDMKNILGEDSQVVFRGIVLSEDELVARQLNVGDMVVYKIEDKYYPVVKLDDIKYLRATDSIHVKDFN